MEELKMNKEQFIALGLSEDLADKAATASADELKTYIPKTRFDEVNTAKKTAEDTLKERDAQLEKLSKDAGASEELKAEITRLQGENKTAKDQYDADLKELTISNAIKAALNGKVHKESVALGLIDKTKLVLDGDKIVGLDEQIKALKESDGYLFKPDDGQQQQQAPGFQVGSNGQGTPPSNTPKSYADAIAAHYNSQQK